MELNNNVENSAELLADAFSEELAKLELGRQFVHYTMEEVVPRISGR